MNEARTYNGVPWTSPLLSPGLISAWITAAAAKHGPAPCLIEVGPSGTETARISYHALAEAVADHAAWLRAEVAPGVRYVGVPMANTIRSVLDLLGVIQFGATAVIVDSSDSAERREEQLCLLSGAVIENGSAGRRVRSINPTIADVPEEARPIAFVLYTTGSTAVSKPVAQSHYAVLVNVQATIRHHRMAPGQVMACALPISHVNGLHFGVLATLLSGGTCVLFRQFDPLSYLRVLGNLRAKRATTVPSLLQVLSELRRWPDLPELGYFVSAAAPLASQTARAIYQHREHRVVQGYGLSECMNFATTMPVGLDDAAYLQGVLDSEVPPVGHALDGCEVAIIGPSGARLADGEVGEVGIRGHSLMTRYLGDSAATLQALGGGWLRTGDLGRLNAAHDGERWLTLVGREKNIAKCGGLSISLEELDRWITSLPGIREACCVRRPDPLRGEAVTAFYVPKPGTSLLPREVEAHVQQRFDARVLGLLTVELDGLPRLRSGKLNRLALAQRLSSR